MLLRTDARVISAFRRDPAAFLFPAFSYAAARHTGCGICGEFYLPRARRRRHGEYVNTARVSVCARAGIGSAQFLAQSTIGRAKIAGREESGRGRNEAIGNGGGTAEEWREHR